ncbi:mutagen-sensitive 301 [Osmia lignaria lignaria]|uniref:mutagen-sensitive 301 n=1 Tax=Osmia lignaria lignaria TaxID=1437193 RepID=UPI00402B1C42
MYICTIKDKLFMIVDIIIMPNTNSFLNNSHVNVNKSSEGQYEIVSKSLQVIDSILSMDDTILRSIEDDEALVSPEMHKKTLDNFTHKWRDTCESNEKLEVSDKSKNNVQIEAREENTLSILHGISPEANNHWLDNTFLNEVFTQLESSNKENDAMEHCIQVATETFENYSGESAFMENIHTSNKEHQNVKLLKRNLIQYNNVIPSKVHCSNDKKINRWSIDTNHSTSIKDDTFYGLSNTVKKLFSQIRGINTLYQWQDECLSLDAIRNRKNLIYALPTSGGKTLVAEILMLKEIICNKRNAIFILPFVAIVQEKVQAMAPFALELDFLIEEYAASKGVYPPKKRRKKKSIYMCTIEKALGLINSLIEEKRFNEIGTIIVDELHLLGESGGRGATLEVILAKTLYVNENIHIVGMSATIGNLNEIAEFLNADVYTKNFRPVEIKEYVKCEDNIWLFDPTAEEILTDVKKINYRYSSDAAFIDPDRLGGLVMDVIPQDSCLIFCSSRKNCENVALLLTRILFKSLEIHKKDEKQNLLNALKSEEGLCPILQKTITFGVAYHHSGLTTEERRLLEDAFKVGTLCVICCTSTLAAGVNLPARRVILRCPYVGNQFVNLSRYKQMTGRAGRTGMRNIGESILICKRDELSKVKELLESKMDDCLSTLHVNKDRGINNLILSALLSSIATTRSELHKISKKTLLNIQQKRLDVNIKHIVDTTITEFLKSGVLKIKDPSRNIDEFKPNISVVIPSQITNSNDAVIENKEKKLIKIRNDTKLELCSLGRAAMKGCIDMQCAYTLYEDLKKTQEHLILVDYLHLLYLVTPYDITSQIKIVGPVYYDVVINLSETQMKTARLLGINEVTISKIRDGIMPKKVEPRVVQRFYVTLILYELWTQHEVYAIAEKFQVNRGVVQNLLNAVSSFAFSVVRFCQELNEFWAFQDLLNTFSKKLSYCCPSELEALMDLPSVKIGRARQLYNAGFKTVQCIAKVQPKDLQDKIQYLSKKVATQIIEAAKMIILEKVENLRDETEDILDGINMNNLKRI